MRPKKPLHRLTAGDLMSRDPTVIPRHMTLHAAALLLAERDISGAPVVDEDDRCVGVLSTTDFMRKTNCEEPPEARHDTYRAPWHISDNGNSGDAAEVEDYMTADPVTVPKSMLIDCLAREMVDAHIHRMIVVDENRRPIGVVSSMDVLAAVARSGLDVPAT